jgi:ribokinase
MTIDVCVIGSSNLDLVARAARIPRPGETILGHAYLEAAGGKGLNQAVAAARSGARTAFVTQVGRDSAGDALVALMLDEHLDTDGVGRVEAPTGRAMITVDDAGENAIVVIPGANAMLLPSHTTLHGSTIARAAVVIAQLEVPVETVIAAFEVARAVGAMTVLNPSPATALRPELLALVDVIVPNEHELAIIGGEDALLAGGVGAVVITEGARGARLVTHDGERRVEPLRVDAVDTTAAGDSFCGALAARLAAGHRLADALRWAAVAGALATTRLGAVPSIPFRYEIEAALTDAG